MHRHLGAVLSAAAIVAALGMSACSGNRSDSAPSTPALPVTSAPPAPVQTPAAAPAPAPQIPPVPVPEALTDVLYRLADPAVPGIEKVDLVEGASADKAVVLDKFATALRDGGYAPMTFDATDIAWSDRDPADVVANITVTPANPDAGGFSFPMEFTPYQRGWQLSERTAEMLLVFGKAPAAGPPAPPG